MVTQAYTFNLVIILTMLRTVLSSSPFFKVLSISLVVLEVAVFFSDCRCLQAFCTNEASNHKVF